MCFYLFIYFFNKPVSFNKVCAWICFHHISKSTCDDSKCCVNSVISSLSCLPVRFDVSFAILTKRCRRVVGDMFYFLSQEKCKWTVNSHFTPNLFSFSHFIWKCLMWTRDISCSSCGVYGCVCISWHASVPMLVFFSSGGHVRVCQKCFMGWWEWTAETFQHGRYQRGAHTHNRSVRAPVSDYHPLLLSPAAALFNVIFSFHNSVINASGKVWTIND